MKQYLCAFSMCQSMFCAIPFPGKLWDEQAKGKMLLFLPIVGLEIGFLWAGLGYACAILGLPPMVTGVCLCAYPYLVTGFIHLDGYMDVTDAVKSWRDLQRRREILKDSHVGSFAVIGIILLMLTQFACFASVPTDADYRVLIFLPAVSRCCSALAVTVLKPMSTSQYASQKTFTAQAIVLTIMMIVFTLSGFLLCGKYALALLGCMMGYSFALRRAYRSLDGMNGDISGYALSIGELCGAAVFTLL